VASDHLPLLVELRIAPGWQRHHLNKGATQPAG
jgi:hypothetical protein